MSTDPSEPLEALAKPPFDDAKADIVLQSSDGVHFRVFKIILSLASPIFADMFSIPLPSSQQSSHEVQVVVLSEHSTALDVALRHLYPVRTPDAVTLRDASVLAEFAHKYQVDGLEKFITHYLMDNVKQDPVGVYAIAARYGYKDMGAKAAQSCLCLPFSRLQSPNVRCATAELHAELLGYHVACGEAASAVTSERGWFSSLGPLLNLNSRSQTGRRGGSNGCTSCITQDFISIMPNQTPISSTAGSQDTAAAIDDWGFSDDGSRSQKRQGPLCLWNYLYRSALVLAHHPAAEAINAEDFVLKAYNCTHCHLDTRRQMLELSGVFGREIQKAVDRVPLPAAVSAHGAE